MKFSINRNTFLSELGIIQRVVAARTTIPILTGVKLELTHRGLTLTGSDASLSIENFLSLDDEKYNLTIGEEGSVVVTSRLFYEIVRKLPDDNLTFEVHEDLQIVITSGASNFNLIGIDSNQYPRLPQVEGDNHIELSTDLVISLINQTAFAASNFETRPILTGVKLEVKNNLFTVVATDSHRMSQRTTQLEENSDVEDFSIIVPSKSLSELAKSLKPSEKSLEVHVMENQVLFKSETLSVYSRLLEGRYPDTSRLIPTNFNTKLVFSIDSLIQSVERASLLSNEGNRNIIKLSLESNDTTISSASELGNVKESIPFKDFEGDSLLVACNSHYLIDALRAFKSIDDEVMLRFISYDRAFILTPVNSSLEFVQLITPVRTA